MANEDTRPTVTGDPRRFSDMPFGRIWDKDGNDVTRERLAPKVLADCSKCGIPMNAIKEDVDAGIPPVCPVCQKDERFG